MAARSESTSADCSAMGSFAVAADAISMPLRDKTSPTIKELGNSILKGL